MKKTVFLSLSLVSSQILFLSSCSGEFLTYYYFTSLWRISFNILGKADLLATNCLNFCLSSFISPFTFRVKVRVKITCWLHWMQNSSFWMFLCVLNISLYSPLACTAPKEKLDAIIIFVPLYIKCHPPLPLPLASFKIFFTFNSLVVWKIKVACPGVVVFWYLSCSIVSELPESVVWLVDFIWGKFCH